MRKPLHALHCREDAVGGGHGALRDDVEITYEEVDTTLLPARPRLYGLVGAEDIEKVWKERAAKKAADATSARDQARAAIDTALRTLSADQRAAVELTYFHGFSYPEIAQIVDCPTDTVKTRMFHARKRLKTAFGGQLDDWL